MKNFKKLLAILTSIFAITISSPNISAFTLDSAIDVTDGLENCHDLDQYEIDDDYLWSDSNEIATISSNSVVLPQYTVGTFFTDNGLECTDHGTVNGVYLGNPCTPGQSCNCKEFESSIQCAGFARYIYKTYQGISINNVSKNYLNTNISTTQTAKSLLQNLPAGTFIKVKARTSSGGTMVHFMIISRITENEIVLYHANYGGNCKVRNMKMSYGTFASYFPYIYYTC